MAGSTSQYPVYDAISVAIAANVAYLVKGAPGLGKTSYHIDMAEAHGAHLEVIISSLRDPTDFAGLPIKVTNPNGDPGVYLAPPLWARRCNEVASQGGEAWVLFDEITTAAPAVQAALLRVMYERWVGDIQLHPNVRVFAAANPPEQAAGGWDLTPPLANRFLHLDWPVNPKNWADGFIQGFPVNSALKIDTKDVDKVMPQFKALVAGFIHSTGKEFFNAVPKDEAKAGGAWPSPRTWEMAVKLMATRAVGGLDTDLDTLLLRGTVGEGAAAAYLGFIKAKDLPDPEALLKDPDKFQLPERGDIVYTVLNGVVAATIGDLTPKRWKAAWTILKLAGEQGAYDVGCAAARTLAQKSREDLEVPLDEIKPYVDMLVEAGLIRDE